MLLPKFKWKNFNLSRVQLMYEITLFIAELRLKRIHNIMDRLYNIRLSNIERYVKSTEKSVFDICKQISICKYTVILHISPFCKFTACPRLFLSFFIMIFYEFYEYYDQSFLSTFLFRA